MGGLEMIGIIALIVALGGNQFIGHARATARRTLYWTSTGIAFAASMVVAVCLK
jgi:ABC-type molybdate transport system permease subunit